MVKIQLFTTELRPRCIRNLQLDCVSEACLEVAHGDYFPSLRAYRRELVHNLHCSVNVQSFTYGNMHKVICIGNP